MHFTHALAQFRLLTHDDLPAVAAMLAKESVTAEVFFGPNTEEQTRAYFGPLLDGQKGAIDEGKPSPHPTFAIIAPRGDFVGECALLPVPFAEGVWEIGYQLDEPWWRRGIGTTAAEFLLWYGTTRLEVRKFVASCFETNRGSARLLKRAGFQLEGRRPEQYIKRTPSTGGERRVDDLSFGLLSRDIGPDRRDGWHQAFGPPVAPAR